MYRFKMITGNRKINFLTGNANAFIVIFLATLLLAGCQSSFKKISPHVFFSKGYVNGIRIRSKGRTLMVYGDPSGQVKRADYVLFTHHRREFISAARKLVEHGAKVVLPVQAAGDLENPDHFWQNFFEEHRFHSAGNMMTNRSVKSMPVPEKVQGGDTICWQGFDIKILNTPGYAENAISYLINIDDKKYGFVGDLIYDKGQILDIYNLQAAVDNTKIGGYHGYCGRLGNLICSLQKILVEDPDIIIPSRGNIIYEPVEAITSLIDRLQKLYKNYLAISSIRWYFDADLETLTSDVQIQLSEVDTNFFAEKLIDDPPSWIIPVSNSRLIISADRSGFLIDCGNAGIIKTLEQMIGEGKLKSLEGVFITHYHDDHVNNIHELVEHFGCKVYANEELQEVLEHPENFYMPCLSRIPIRGINYLQDREEMQWHEFRMRFYYFPGQTLYHGAVLVDNKDEDVDILFIGDSFSPTGIDDYSLPNRNLLHKDRGYYKCLTLLKDLNQTKSSYYLINQHIHPPFWFSNEQIDAMIANLDQRQALFSAVFPWKDINFGLDPQWARLYPYHIRKNAGEEFEISLRILNHSANAEKFIVDLLLPDGFFLKSKSRSLFVNSLEEKQLTLTLNTLEDIRSGLYVIPAMIQNPAGDLIKSIECCLEIL